MKEELQRLTIAPMELRPMAPELTLNGLVVTITDARPRLALEAAVTVLTAITITRRPRQSLAMVARCREHSSEEGDSSEQTSRWQQRPAREV